MATHPARTPPEGLSAQPEPRVAALLRRAVLDHVTGERRLAYPPRLHVGTPGAPHAVFAVDAAEPADHALRTDVVAALRHRAGADGMVWLVRTGDLTLQDVDAAWLSAARTAYAEAGTELVFVVVNRHGWWDPRSGASRRWQRPRER